MTKCHRGITEWFSGFGAWYYFMGLPGGLFDGSEAHIKWFYLSAGHHGRQASHSTGISFQLNVNVNFGGVSKCLHTLEKNCNFLSTVCLRIPFFSHLSMVTLGL